MRRLNLLRQLLYTATIGAIDGWAPSTRLLAATLNQINSRRGWPDVLPISNRDLLTAAGYKQSRYSQSIIGRFREETAASGVIDSDIADGITVYLIHELTAENLRAAKKRAAPPQPSTVPPSLAAKLAANLADSLTKNCAAGANGAPGGSGNDRNDRNALKGKVKKNGKSPTEDEAAAADQLVRELEEIGL